MCNRWLRSWEEDWIWVCFHRRRRRRDIAARTLNPTAKPPQKIEVMSNRGIIAWPWRHLKPGNVKTTRRASNAKFCPRHAQLTIIGRADRKLVPGMPVPTLRLAWWVVRAPAGRNEPIGMWAGRSSSFLRGQLR